MTNEKMLALLQQINLEDGLSNHAKPIVKEVMEGIEENIRVAANKKNGKLTTATVANKVIKNAEKLNATRSVYGAWIKDGKQYFCDTHRAFQINNPLELKPIPDDCEPIKIDNIFDSFEGTKEDFHTVDIPEDLKGEYAVLKAKKNKCQHIVCNLNDVIINADYLLDVVKALGATQAYVGNKSGYKCPVYFETEIGKAMILPINVNNRTELGETKYWIV